MKQKRLVKKARTADKELAEAIRKAQQQPGIADLMDLMQQSHEVEALMHEQREAALVTKVVSATATSP